jgi:hypothetical protein
MHTPSPTSGGGRMGWGPATMAEIRVENLRKAFGTFTAVRDSTFTVRNG